MLNFFIVSYPIQSSSFSHPMYWWIFYYRICWHRLVTCCQLITVNNINSESWCHSEHGFNPAPVRLAVWAFTKVALTQHCRVLMDMKCTHCPSPGWGLFCLWFLFCCVLTKRPHRLADWLPADWPLAHTTTHTHTHTHARAQRRDQSKK